MLKEMAKSKLPSSNMDAALSKRKWCLHSIWSLLVKDWLNILLCEYTLLINVHRKDEVEEEHKMYHGPCCCEGKMIQTHQQ